MNLDELFSGPPTAAKWRALGRYLKSQRLRPGIGVRIAQDSVNGTIISARRSVPRSAPAVVCPFGSTVSVDVAGVMKPGIRGGIVHAGVTSFTVADAAMPTAAGRWLAYVSVVAVVNQDDDETLLLPGLASGTSASAIQFVAEDSGLPSGTAPAVGTGSGTAILSIGLVEVVGTSPVFYPDGCGNYTLDHCAGTLSYRRL